MIKFKLEDLDHFTQDDKSFEEYIKEKLKEVDLHILKMNLGEDEDISTDDYHLGVWFGQQMILVEILYYLAYKDKKKC